MKFMPKPVRPLLPLILSGLLMLTVMVGQFYAAQVRFQQSEQEWLDEASAIIARVRGRHRLELETSRGCRCCCQDS